MSGCGKHNTPVVKKRREQNIKETLTILMTITWGATQPGAQPHRENTEED